MSFNEQPFGYRFGKMGDEAEEIYEAVHPLGKTIRFGFRRPKGIDFKSIKDVFRHMPDYITESNYLVEVMGLGRSGVLKSVKLEKYEALKVWAFIARLGSGLVFFIWNSHEEEYLLLDWDAMKKIVSKYRNKVEEFNDGNKYYPLPWGELRELATIVGKWHNE